MKIAIVATVGRTIDAFLCETCSGLERRGHEVVLISSDQPRSAAGRWCELPMVRSLSPMKLARSVVHARRILKAEQVDIIQVHTPIAAAAIRLAASLPLPMRPWICYFVHGFHFQIDTSKRTWSPWFIAERVLATRTDHFQLISGVDATVVERWGAEATVFPGVGVDLVRIQYEGARADAESSLALGRSGDGGRVLFLGELNRNKGSKLLAECITGSPELEWLVVGAGPEEHRIAGLDRANWIRSLDDVGSAFAAVDALVSLSRREGVPVGIMEAAALGIPVVATPNRGSLALKEKGIVTYIVDRDRRLIISRLHEAIRGGRTAPRVYSHRKIVSESIVDDLLRKYSAAISGQ